MDILIIDAIFYLKEKKKRPSVEAIYDKLKDDDPSINDDDFCDVFKTLESKRVLRNIKPKDDLGSYHVCENFLLKLHMKNLEEDLNDMKIRESMVIQKLNEQIDFLMVEMEVKNTTIQRLLKYVIESETGNDNQENINEKGTAKESICIITPTSIDTTKDNKQQQIEVTQQQNDEREKKSKEQQEQLNKQLIEIRKEKHNTYIEEKYPENKSNENETTLIEENEEINDKHQWKAGTVLITGDSILNGLIEKRLGSNVKVRPFPGAKIKDMHSYLIPLIEKKPKYIIVHVSTNDAIDKSSIELTNELMQLKEFIEISLPGSVVILSFPIIRLDNNQADSNLIKLRENLVSLNINAIENNNITKEHLGKFGLHLNAKGSGRLAMNYISCIRHL